MKSLNLTDNNGWQMGYQIQTHPQTASMPCNRPQTMLGAKCLNRSFKKMTLQRNSGLSSWWNYSSLELLLDESLDISSTSSFSLLWPLRSWTLWCDAPPEVRVIATSWDGCHDSDEALICGVVGKCCSITHKDSKTALIGGFHHHR